MRRAGRIIFNGVALLSLGMLVATTALWVRSGTIIDRYNWAYKVVGGTGHGYDRYYLRCLISEAGRIRYYREDGGYPLVPNSITLGWTHRTRVGRATLVAPEQHLLGSIGVWRSAPLLLVSVRYWLVVTVTALAPVAWLALNLLRRRRSAERGFAVEPPHRAETS
jgi:hypothetical protein